MSEVKLDWDVIIQLLAAGNPFIWGLVVIALLCLSVLAWIKYEEQLRRLASCVLQLCSKKYRSQLDQQSERMEICKLRYEKLAERIYGLTCRISDLRIDPDAGRNKFYQFIVKAAFEAYYKAFVTLFTDYCAGKIPESEFTSYRKTHHQPTANALNDVKTVIKERLQAQGWPEEKINYVNDVFKMWISAHIGLLRELLANDEMSIEVVKSWLVFFYEMYTDVEKFGLMINGRITGMKFDNFEIKGPHHG